MEDVKDELSGLDDDVEIEVVKPKCTCGKGSLLGAPVGCPTHTASIK